MNAQQAQNRPTIKIAKPYNDEAIERAVISILRSGMLVQGAKVKEFEAALAAYIGCRNVIAVNSGTAALHLALHTTYDSKKEKGEVVTTPLSFAATANAVLAAGLNPVFADVDPETFNIDPDNVSEKINDRTVAIEPVDVYGLPAEFGKLGQLAKRHKLTSRRRFCGSDRRKLRGKKNRKRFGPVLFQHVCHEKSAHRGRWIHYYERRRRLLNKIRMERNQGQASRYNQKSFGYNFRMLEICAAIGLGQIGILDELNQKRRRNARCLTDGLEDLECINFQSVDHPENHAWYMFALTLDEKAAGISRDKLVQKSEGGRSRS